MSIENLRTGIDEIDSEIIRLLNRRCELACWTAWPITTPAPSTGTP